MHAIRHAKDRRPPEPATKTSEVDALCTALTGLRQVRPIGLIDEVRHVPFPAGADAVRLIDARDGSLIARLRGRPGVQPLAAMDLACAVATDPRYRHRRWTGTTSRPTPDGTLELVIHSQWRLWGWLRRR